MVSGATTEWENTVSFSRQFERNTMLWTSGDIDLGRVRTGSPRHYAVLDALEFLLEHPAVKSLKN